MFKVFQATTVGRRIFFVIIAVVLMMLAVALRGVVGFYSEFLEETRWNEVSFNVEDRMNDLAETRNNIQQEYEKVIRYTLLYKERNDERLLEVSQKARQDYLLLRASFFQKLDRLVEHLEVQKKYLKSKKSKNSLDTLSLALQQYSENKYKYLENIEAIFVLVNQNRLNEAVLLEDALQSEESQKDNLKAIQANTQNTFAQIKKELEGKRIQVLIEMMGLLLLGILASLYLGISLRKKIVTPLRKAVIAANEISKGNRDISINYQYNIKEPKMLMASMSEMLEAIKKTEILYNEEKNYAHAILQSSPVPLLVLKDGFVVEFKNKEFVDVFDVREDIRGKDLFEDYGKETWKESGLKELLEKVATSEDGFFVRNHEWSLQVKNGSKKIFLTNIDKITKENTKSTILLITFVDISLRKKYETDIILAKEVALEASQAKTLFLSTMSHEIRTPLNAILGIAEILAGTNLNKDQARYVKIFQRAGETLLSVVNDVLDFAKIEKGEIRIENVPFSLLETVESACELMALKAHEKNLELIIDIDPRIPDMLVGDSARIKQILINLLSNAVKFTEKGEVKVSVSAKSEGNGIYNIVFQVTDSGIGISKDNQEHIFESFRQAESSTTRMFGGSGLGLSICKKILEKMNGEISVTSELKSGSTFSFSVPLEALKGDEADRDNKNLEELLKGKKVLIFSENKTQRNVLADMTKRWGAETTCIWDKESIYDFLEKSSPPFHFDFFLFSHSESKEFTQAWMETLVKCGIQVDYKILIFSAEHAKAGFKVIKNNDSYYYIMKPLRERDLVHVIEKVLYPQLKVEKKADNAFKFKSKNNSPYRVLIVEDSKDNQLVLTSFLKSYPFKVSICENGEEAVSRVQSTHFDLILMDIEMPKMDGKTATKKIHELIKDEKIKTLPIIALTAHAYDDERLSIKKFGFDSVLSKPIKKDDLINELFKFLPVEELEGIHSEVDREMQHLVPQYVKNRKAEIVEVERAYFENNYEYLYRIGHQLKGNASIYGFHGLQDIGQALEEYAESKNKLKLGPVIEELKHYVERIVHS